MPVPFILPQPSISVVFVTSENIDTFTEPPLLMSVGLSHEENNFNFISNSKDAGKAVMVVTLLC